MRHAPVKQTKAGSIEAVKPVGWGVTVAPALLAITEVLETNGTPFKSWQYIPLKFFGQAHVAKLVDTGKQRPPRLIYK